MKLLLVEDERELSEALFQILTNNKYSVDAVYDGEDGLDYALTGVYDVIVLDIMIPKLNGLSLLKQLRKSGISTPVIMLTAKSQIEDRVLGLDLGADDYLTKPFATEELLARLRSITRRKGNVVNDNILTYGDISLNLDTYDLDVNNENIRLTLKEFEIIKYFMERPKCVVSKDDLITKLWGFDSEVEYNNIEVYISFIRKKLTYLKSNVSIVTIRGVGYRMEDSIV
ncbi:MULTISPECIES: response regulator transcription factor [Clostridium]|jgi:DNA-binding response OmpR family regulator|uniref:response regulator transcription factor n=1 Tax=Clostridium TaxID=1485 RepID=UPI00232C914D|nr:MULTISPECIES: response regulator transcription factor [Clostridium]MDB1932920.1 response regulator transcription factor [Clostridium tertium]MDB1936983.1 response regulator transcription factor [Clostridium tertium]MDU1279865.1 response regulator transcription factor [Clostridium sp.]MDU3349256.1 response regulator transcription factor [Clostridium sp.]MDU3407103.1 response regulator transcription factor [Clostridium sp.]